MTEQQQQTLDKIQAIMREIGDFSPDEIGEEYINLFPNSTSTKKVEFIAEDNVRIGHYLSDVRIDDEDISYEELVDIAPDGILDDILRMAEDRQVDLDKTMDRCLD
jgi:hypothetical protein